MANDRDSQSLQIFIQSPDLQIPTKTLTLTQSQLSQPLRSLNLVSSSSFYLTFNGKPISETLTLQTLGIQSLSTLILRRRTLLGGGGDGGATGAESRDCYLKMYAEKKPDKVDPNEQRLSKWLNCALSNEPLKPPCVVDRLGNLFNKETLVEALLGKKIPREFGHIRGLKDMVKIEPFLIAENLGSSLCDAPKFQCPISGFEFNGKYKFVALKTCGHVLSVKAMREVKTDKGKTSSCLVCHREFGENDKIVINGSEEEVLAMRERMEIEKKGKKSGKRALKNNDESLGVEKSVLGPDSEMENGVLKAELKGLPKGGVKVSNNGKSDSNKRFKAIDVVPENATKEVYASIFTSSKKKSDIRETYMCRSLPLGRN